MKVHSDEAQKVDRWAKLPILALARLYACPDCGAEECRPCDLTMPEKRLDVEAHEYRLRLGELALHDWAFRPQPVDTEAAQTSALYQRLARLQILELEPDAWAKSIGIKQRKGRKR